MLDEEKRRKLETAKSKLERRYQFLFNETVKYIQEGKMERAQIYAGEAAYVKNLIKIINKILS